MNATKKQHQFFHQRTGLTIRSIWRRARVGFVALAAIGLTGCVVLPADTVIYDDDASVELDGHDSPDVVIIDRGPVYAPPPFFWRDSDWRYRHGYRHRYHYRYRDGRRLRGRGDARWEGRQGRGSVERGARPRDGGFRGRARSNSPSRSMTPHLETK